MLLAHPPAPGDPVGRHAGVAALSATRAPAARHRLSGARLLDRPVPSGS